MAFVGTKDKLKPEQLQELINSLFAEPAYFCERQVDKITPFTPGLPNNFSAPEGQIFNHQRELRWKKTRKGFNVLVLSLEKPAEVDLNPVQNNWITETRNAYLHNKDETRFPKGVHALSADIDSNKFSLGQRYFKDTNTATIHFVALTITKPQ